MLVFIAYKYCYPLPDFSSDAQAYIYAAMMDYKAYYRPFGYSHFLQIVHGLSSSPYLVVAVQYALLALAGSFSFFSIDYLYTFRNKKVKFLSWLLVTVNPCLLALANLMLSDAVFIAFSAMWFTLFLWIIKEKKWWCLVLQLLFLYISFQIRYNALYYPIITAVVFLFTPRMKLPYRLTGMAASFFLVFSAYTTIKKQNYRATGTEVFAGFSGWQMANNALLIYKKADVKSSDFDKPELQQFDKVVKYLIDSIDADAKIQIAKGMVPSTAFLWDKNSPLKRYAFYVAHTNKTSYHSSWYALSEMYGEYGSEIIKQHPKLYFQNYLLPNFYQYFIPPAELMSTYDEGKTALTDNSRTWLNLKDPKLHANVTGVQDVLMYPYPVLHSLLLLFGFIVPALYLWKRRKQERKFRASFVFPVILWYIMLCADMGFNILASPVTLRYVVLLFIIGYGLPFYYLDRLLDKGSMAEADEMVPEEQPKTDHKPRKA